MKVVETLDCVFFFFSCFNCLFNLLIFGMYFFTNLFLIE